MNPPATAEQDYVVPGTDRRGFRHQLSRLRSYLLLDPLIYLTTGIMGTISLTSSFFDEDGRLQHAVARQWAKMILRIAGTPVTVIGLERVDWTKPAVYAANHLSSFDIPVLYSCLPTSFRIIAKKELFTQPFVGWHLRRSRQIPVDEKNARASFRSLHNAIAAVQHGHPIVIFPEGGRAPHGRLQPFMSGPFYLAVKAGVPIIPMAILGTYETLPMNTFHIMPRPLKLVIGDPIPSTGHSLRELDALSAEVEIAIRGLIAQASATNNK